MSVAPSRVTLNTTSAEEEFLYELQPSHALPVINCKRYVKDVLFRPAPLKTVNRWLHRGRYLLSFSFMIGAMSSFALYMAPANVGRWVGVSLLVTEGPGILATMISLRYDMLVLLGGVFEIWYASLLSLSSMSLLAIYMRDSRAIGMVMSIIGFEIIVLLDANNRLVAHTILICCVISVTYSMCSVYVAAGLIPDTNARLVLFAYGPHRLHAEDIITNGLATAILIYLRNAYRKHMAFDRRTRACQPFVVPCITYRCRLSLRRVKAPGQLDLAPVMPTQPATSLPSASDVDANYCTQMRYVSPHTVYNASDTLIVSRLTPRGDLNPSSSFRVVLMVLAGVGILSNYSPLFVWALSLNAEKSRTIGRAIAWVGLTATTSVVLTISAFYQRGLFKRLCTNFDFLFLSSQVTLAMVAAGDVFAWDGRCFSLVTSWVWIHLVLSLDALPPVWRVRLGVSKKFVVAVTGLSVVQCVVFFRDLVMWEGLNLRDREMFTLRIAGKEHAIHVVPFLFGRLVSMLSWSLRLLWRYGKYWPEGLVILQGRVEYTDTHMAARHHQRVHQQALSTSSR